MREIATDTKGGDVGRDLTQTQGLLLGAVTKGITGKIKKPEETFQELIDRMRGV